ncbi:2053_t:CDS:2, partial [Gigaspora rosea]
DVEKVLFGEDKCEKISKCKLIIQGLVPASLEKESMAERYFKNKAFEALSWKFHEKIWTLRYKAVAEYEELSGMKKMKRKRVNENEKEEGIDEREKATRSRKRQKKDEKEKNEDALHKAGLAFCRLAL